jgi:hypothetical protein
MNKILLYSMLAAIMMMVACDPIEDRDVMSGAITANDLQISATPVLVNGKKSNSIMLNSDGVGCLSSWNYGNGITTSTKTTVQLVLKGANDIVFTGLNHDGTTITKTLTVQIDTLINVPAEWGILCGSGTKSWVWDDSQTDGVWGNGGYKGNTSPGWWKVVLADVDGQTKGEGIGAEMVFSVHGSSLTKKKADGTSVVGSFTFDMSAITKDDGGAVWAKGKLVTKNVTVLSGKQPNSASKNDPIYEYDILKLDKEKMVLAWPEPGAGSWGTAWFWMFKAK